MTGKTHAMIGANVVWLAPLLGLSASPVLIPLGGLAALLPDLDASESTVKHLEISFGSGRSRIGVKPFAPFAFVLSRLFKHRGWLHSWAAVIAAAGLSFALLDRWGVAVPAVITLGYFSHLAADALTKHGIQFLLPIKRTWFLLPKPIRVRTGGLIDNLLFVVGAFGIVLFAWARINM